jgi:hypothetical protein
MKCVECRGSGEVKQQSGYREMDEPAVIEKPKASRMARLGKWVGYYSDPLLALTAVIVGTLGIIFLCLKADANVQKRTANQTWMFVDRFNGTQKCFLSRNQEDFVVSSQGVKVFLSDMRNPEIPASLGVADLNQCVRLSK